MSDFYDFMFNVNLDSINPRDYFEYNVRNLNVDGIEIKTEENENEELTIVYENVNNDFMNMMGFYGILFLMLYKKYSENVDNEEMKILENKLGKETIDKMESIIKSLQELGVLYGILKSIEFERK